MQEKKTKHNKNICIYKKELVTLQRICERKSINL